MRTVLLLSALATLTAFSAHADDWLYLTVPGDTLSGIGQTYLRNPKDWPKVQSANGVAIPKHLPANSRLKIPVDLLKVTPAPVQVVAVKGNVRFKTASGPFQPLSQGAELHGGESVLTGFGASASYRFADNTRLTQQASSKLTFGRLASYGKTGMVATEISLDNGRLDASAAKQLAPAGGFKVRTPVSVAGLRGTEFRLNVAEDGKSMRNEVTEGVVAVSAEGQEVRVETGYGTVAELGKPPSPPVRLLPQPDLSALPAMVTRLPLSFDWTANQTASAWRVQLSKDKDFLTLLRDEMVVQPSVQWESSQDDALPDGNYFLRVRGIDSLGLEGFDAVHAFTLNVLPLPPMPVKPALGERLPQHDVDLAWLPAEGAQGYLLQLAPTPEFSQGLIEKRLPPGDARRVTLPSGEWHWRLASLDKHGQPRAFSAHRAFRVLPKPATPVLASQYEQMTSTEPETTLQWQAAEDAQAYRLQLAATRDFAQPLIDLRTTETQLSVRAPAAGDWYWRVAALGAEDVASAFSKTGIWRFHPLPAAPGMPQTRLENGLLIAGWNGAADSYRVELSRNELFTEVVANLVVPGREIRLVQPDAGKYWLRVTALNAEKRESAPSPATPVEVKASFKPWWLLPLLLFAP